MLTSIKITTLSVAASLMIMIGAPLPAHAQDAKVVPVIRIRGPLAEAPPPLSIGELFGEEPTANMFQLLERLRAARTDENVAAVVFDIDEAQLGLAQIQELRAQVEALKANDKDVWVFVESLQLGNLMFGSAASHFWLLPSGDVSVLGLYSEASYYKNMLDNIKVEADILHCGDYKSAGEPFYRTGPSKEAEEQINWLLDSIFEQVVEAIAKSRRIAPEEFKELMDKGSLSPKEALAAKLVDKLAYREDFTKQLKKRYGDDVKITRRYGQKKGPDIDFGNPFAFFQVFSDLMKGKKASTKPAVAVVHVESMITQGRSEESPFGGSSNAGSTTIRAAIAKAAADKSVKALVLRVDSPGGSAVASDIICEATKRFKKSGRPFIVSMGNVAGSGGYYVSALADAIFAEPTTITGSIGVVGGKLVTKGLWDWVGITGHEYKRGKHSDMMNTNRRFTDEEREIVRSWMDRIYEEFKGRVLEGREDRIKGDLETLAGGRVYTGKQALDIGLVDRLGGLSDAIKYAAGEAELGNDYEIRMFPQPKTLIDKLLEGLSDKEEDADSAAVRLDIGGRFGGLPHVASALEVAGKLDPQKARALEQFLIQMELFSSECVLMIGPGYAMTGIPGMN